MGRRARRRERSCFLSFVDIPLAFLSAQYSSPKNHRSPNKQREPEVEVSQDALVHMADDAHANIDTDAVSESVRTAFQTNLLVLKLRLRTVWAPLATGAVQMVESVTW
jgi:hypothetical protein